MIEIKPNIIQLRDLKTGVRTPLMAIKGDKGDSIYVGDRYSYEEHLIGKWVDGKDLYRRVYKITEGIANGNEIRVDDKPQGMIECPHSWGTIKSGPTAGNGYNSSYVNVVVRDNGVFAMQTMTGYADYMYVVIEYTKDEVNNSSILGKAILGRMILGKR